MHILKQHDLSRTVENLKTPAIISSALVLPFMILGLVNQRNLNAGFPVVLFVFMWLLALSFMVILKPILRSQPTWNRDAQYAQRVAEDHLLDPYRISVGRPRS